MTLQQHMIALLERLAPEEGYNLSPLPDVRFLRSNRPLSRTPVLYEPGIVLLCQGRKRGYLGEQVYTYDAQHYLVVSVPVPFIMQTEASAEAPMLAVYMRLDFQLAGELVMAVDDAFGPSQAEPRGMYASPMCEPLAGSLLRFLEAMQDPADARILGPALVRELYYRVLAGEQGGSLRAALGQQGHFARVGRAIRLIHDRYAGPLNIAMLAQEARMSLASFHRHFLGVTGSTPLQYLKSTRLHQARLLMLRGEMSAAQAAFEVGYESASQFSREFKRFFGRTPVEEVRWIKATYALPAPDAPSPFVSSH